MKIIPARPEDSHLIGESVVEAIGIEIAQNLAGENHTLEDVVNMFAMLAKRDDTQYSYTNTLVALDDRGNPVGVCVGYDGARLHELRLPFFEAVPLALVLALKVWRMSVMPKSFISTLLRCCLNIAAKALPVSCLRNP